MTTITDLRTAFLDLLYELKGSDIKVIIAGGFGVFLKMEYVKNHFLRTLLNEWPEPRSTKDLYLFLRPELLINPHSLGPLRDAFTKLGYTAVPGAEKYQFIKAGGEGMEHAAVKIDLLTGPQNRFAGTRVKTDNRRARPNPSVGIHAHPVDEAPTLEDGLAPVILNGTLSSGNSWQVEIYLPHPYTFLILKLFAFRDQFNNPANAYARHHALDLYSILATTTESEWEYALVLRDKWQDEPKVIEAGIIVSEYFSDINRMGMIRLRESPYYRPALQPDGFMSALMDLFPKRE